MTWRWLTIAVLITSCNTPRNERPAQFDKEGHRGCRGLMPENTIPAMIKAVELGVNTLEMDVAFTSDMKAILSHDPYFNHDITTKPDVNLIDQKDEKQFNLFRMTYDEVTKYDVGIKGNPHFPKQQKMKAVKPLLADVIDCVEAYVRRNHLQPVHYNIETKTKPATDNVFHPAPAVFVDAMMKVIVEKSIANRVIIQSFDVRTLQYLHPKFPAITTSLLIEPSEMMTTWEKIDILGFKPDIISPEYHMVNDALISEAHKKNIRVIPWTVNDKKTIQELKEMGVDGVITDYPNLF